MSTSTNNHNGHQHVLSYAPGIDRVQLGVKHHLTLLDRYSFIKNMDDIPEAVEPDMAFAEKVTLNTQESNQLPVWVDQNGLVILKQLSNQPGRICFELPEGRRLFGLGDRGRLKNDSSQDRLERRGEFADLWLQYNTAYAPVPLLVSHDGVGLLINETRRLHFDLGHNDPSVLSITCENSETDLEYYVLLGDGPMGVLRAYARLTGRPILPPRWALGLTYLCHIQASARDVIEDALRMRQMDIPCDSLGLEPGWMNKFYDYSVEKQWNQNNFWFPKWLDGPNPQGTTFLKALKNMGYHIGLWLCNEYDLTYEEERRSKQLRIAKQNEHAAVENLTQAADKQAEHGGEAIYADQLTKPDEPWFEHLKKFIDQGVCFFKNDPAKQVNEHPDRLYGNGLTDAHVHNLYPELWSRQQYEGFARHTNLRPWQMTCSGWIGMQAHAATWAGDTGGETGALCGILNMAMVGQGLASCDMATYSAEGIHMGMLLPWALHNNWAQWSQPWLLPQPLQSMYVEYAKLRYRLLPYLYSWAWHAHQTGEPLLRPMPLMWPDDPQCDQCLKQFILGESLLVGAYTHKLYLPQGNWFDFWTGKLYQGGRWIDCTWPDDKGGPLFVRSGGILILSALEDHLTSDPPDQLHIHLYHDPQAQSQTITHHVDDGLSSPDTQQSSCDIQITTRHKEHGMQAFIECAHFQSTNSICVPSMTLLIHGMNAIDKQVTIMGEQIPFSTTENVMKIELGRIQAGEKQQIQII
jgi:alpha-glucosidase (family GH31 glycosyl hydrolase)